MAADLIRNILRKTCTALLISLLSCGFASAQSPDDTYYVGEELAQDTVHTFPDTAQWDIGGLMSLNFSQVSLSNWAGGGQSSISATGILNLHADMIRKKSTWDNNLDLGYGIVKQDERDLVKSDDKIDLTSKYGRYAFKNWFYSGLLNFKSQFDKGYDYPTDTTKVRISDFLAPAYVLFALGMDHKPNDHLSLFMSPMTAKYTIVNDQQLADAGAFGVDPAEYDPTDSSKISDGKKTRLELGGYLKFAYSQKDLMKNVGLQTRLELFSSYTNNPQNIDVIWETVIDFKVNNVLSANLTTTLIYDDDIDIQEKDGDAFGPRTQFKEVFGLGLSYKF